MAMVSSSSSATVAVDKATSDLLIGPDWTMNMDICDSINTNHWLAKDVVKAVKKRLQHKNPRVQLLSLTLLETMVKNCGDYVHFQIAEKNILGEMVKIVKKKSDMHVRDKILVLLDAWQEAFGGPGGKHPQYYWAYEELRRSGVEFPQRSLDTAPIFTPPVTNPTLRPAQAGYGMPSNSSRRLDETMATEIEGLSMSSLDSMRNVMDLLGDMLHAVNPADREAVKDEIIVDLVERCRSNQKKLMQMLTTTGDEELLGRGLELNDSLQVLLAKHDAIASGSPMPSLLPSSSSKPSEGRSSDSKLSEVRDSSPKAIAIANTTKSQIDEEEEEEDDFAQLARRHSKPQSSPVQATTESAGALVLAESSSATSSVPTAAIATPSNALALADPPAPVRTTKDQDIIDLLSLTLSTTSTSQNPETPQNPPSSNQNMPENEVPSATQGNPYAPQTYPGNQGQVPYNSYVVPWAQPQVQHRFNPSALPQQQCQSFPQTQQPSLHQQQMQTLSQPQLQSQPQPHLQSQYPQYTTGYPPPPWAGTPGYANNQNYSSVSSNMFSNPRANLNAYSAPAQAGRPLQHYNSFPTRVDPQVNSGASNPTTPGGQKPFIPSYRLFEDLNVLGNADRRMSGSSGQSMVSGRKY